MILLSPNHRNGPLCEEITPGVMRYKWISPRAKIDALDWYRVSDFIRGFANNWICCKCLGNFAHENRRSKLHVHEQYAYDLLENKVMLVDLMPVCIMCHCVMHKDNDWFINEKDVTQEKIDEHIFTVNQRFPNFKDDGYGLEMARIIEADPKGIKVADYTHLRKYIAHLQDKVIGIHEIYDKTRRHDILKMSGPNAKWSD